MQQRVLSLLVQNTTGVTSRISGLFSRRGYNIDSFSSGVTTDPRYTRITIVTSGEDLILDQIGNQLAKLIDVVDIKILKDGESVTRELVLLKVRANASQRQGICGICDIFRAKIIDVAIDSMIIELTGDESKLNAFITLIGDYEILELARTGITGLSRGTDNIYQP